MFANNELLRKKTPQNGTGRQKYIQHLVDEFHTTTNVEAQEQITANLANFAYDPINAQFLRDAFASDLFLQLLSLPNNRLVLHGIAGITNICLDPISRKQISETTNINLLLEVFQLTENIEIAINLLTLFHLLLSEDETIKAKICTSNQLRKTHDLMNSSDRRLNEIAKIFIEDFAARTIEIIKK